MCLYGEGRARLLGLGQDLFFSEPNTVADFSLFLNIRLSILCKNLFFPVCLKDSFLNPPPPPLSINKKKKKK